MDKGKKNSDGQVVVDKGNANEEIGTDGVVMSIE